MFWFWLDHLIFGNGFGLRSPFHDNRFYWLSGDLYTFSSGLGAQLTSFQWTHPNAGERRRLCGRIFHPVHSSRRWFRVRVAWNMTDMPKELDEMQNAIRQLKHDLDNM